MNLDQARELAAGLQAEMAPHCERVAVAGSVRRGCEACKDLELVAIPRWEPGPVFSLFGDAAPVNVLHGWALAAARKGLIWIKPGTSEIIPWPPKPGGKYWRGLLPGGVKLDLFLTTTENWGAILAIRTGAAEFSKALVTHALQIGWRFRDGQLWNPAGEAVPTPEEADVFERLNLRWCVPAQRTGPEALRVREQAEAGR